MVFKWKDDSFLKEITGQVISCEPAIFKEDEQDVTGYNVVLDDSVLFPEGGGQPCDWGTLNGKPVRNVTRVDGRSIHFVCSQEPFEVGQTVVQLVNWDRRLDHMQQHSGQHLLSAIFWRDLQIETLSWCLGTNTSYIELDTASLTSDQIQSIENTANDLIFEGRIVSVSYQKPEEATELDSDVPALDGLIRFINIDGIESNRCCGTHVSNLSQLQVIKLLHTDKTRQHVLIHFLCGKRVLRQLDECLQREQKLKTILKGNPSSHVELITKLQASSRKSQKFLQQTLKDVAILEAEKLQNLEMKPKYLSMHRKYDPDVDFISYFLRAAPKDIFYFLSVSDGANKNLVVIKGDPELIERFAKPFMDILDGKGSNRGGSFQAKVNRINNISKCEQMLKEYFSG